MALMIAAENDNDSAENFDTPDEKTDASFENCQQPMFWDKNDFLNGV